MTYRSGAHPSCWCQLIFVAYLKDGLLQRPINSIRFQSIWSITATSYLRQAKSRLTKTLVDHVRHHMALEDTNALDAVIATLRHPREEMHGRAPDWQSGGAVGNRRRCVWGHCRLSAPGAGPDL